MNISRKMRSISRWLGSFPSLSYAGIYLILIPLFGGFFYLLPCKFYQSTFQYEGSSTTLLDSIYGGLESAVEKQFSENSNLSIHGEGGEPDFNSWTVDIGYVTNIRIEEYKVSFTLNPSLSKGRKQESNIHFGTRHIANLPVNMSFPLINGDGELPLTFELSSEVTSIFTDHAAQIEFEKALFPSDRTDSVVTIELPYELTQRMRRYAVGFQNLNSEIDGNFWRLTYFSACTITTIGYGDIVPMNSWARFLTSLEGILGIIFVGLFLNALAFERTFVEPTESETGFEKPGFQ